MGQREGKWKKSARKILEKMGHFGERRELRRNSYLSGVKQPPRGARMVERLREKFHDVLWTYDARHGVWDGNDGSQVRGTFSVHDDEDAGLPPTYYRYYPGTARVPDRLDF